ncbi:hypothetical protein [Cellvibrio sp. PSBB023]|uniref:hypothetical protein n=1 Tax=Cellvibrio sp. PSBB023 TaxID=1945512 RepID=UPI00098FC941|nr:hypothetical protein [Cellvibrio sp. PSBB023]AQT59173.1 hypothetical protein B0D95_03035 [Cellvibrio sp. PSBB023]
MIREYAVNPEVICSSVEILQRFFSDFGADKGRVIGAIPHQWYRDIERRIQLLGLTTIAKRKCFDNLRSFEKSSLVKRDGKPLDAHTWVEKAKLLNGQEIFEGILSDQVSVDEKLYDYRNMLESVPADWDIEQTKSVQRDALLISSAIEKSLRFSNRPVLFIDPYFDPLHEDSRTPIINCISSITAGRFGLKKIFIHTCEQQDIDYRRRKIRTDIERGMNECVQPLLPQGFEVELWVWPNNYIHDRFVITNHVGYAYGHGLSAAQFQDAIQVNINRISESARQFEYRRFSTAAGRLGDEIFIVGA